VIDLGEMRAALADAEYKPGWSLWVWEPDPIQGPYLTVETTVANAYRPDETVALHIHSPVPPMVTRAAFLTWVLWRLRMVAIHEAMEWFRVDGKPWFDPHDPPDHPDH
jgi:hypothetical protein